VNTKENIMETYPLLPLDLMGLNDSTNYTCNITEGRDNIDNDLVLTLNISCLGCKKNICGLGEYVCATNIARQLMDERKYSSMIIEGKGSNQIFNNDQLIKIYRLVRIYSKITLVTKTEKTDPACVKCHEYLSKLFATFKAMVIADPGFLYKNRKFLKSYSSALCGTCGQSLLDFVHHIEHEFHSIDSEWCETIDEIQTFKIDYYTPLIEIKKHNSTVLTKMKDVNIYEERRVGGYIVRTGTENFNLGNSTNDRINMLFPVAETDFRRRQKLYIVDLQIPPHLEPIIESMKDFIYTDSETKRIIRYTFQSDLLREVISTKIKQKLPSILKEHEIESLSEHETEILQERVIQYTVGWGIWEIFMKDDLLNEFSAIAGSPVNVETYTDGKCKTNVIPSIEEYERFLRLLRINIPVDFFNHVLETVIDPVKHPIKFSRMRLTLFDNPLVENYTFIVRKHRKTQLSGGELLNFGTVSPDMLGYCIAMKRRNKSNMVYVGDVGSGKTTVQFIVDTKIPIDSTVITIGDIVELDMSEMGFNNVTLYADRPGEEMIGQSRHTLIAKTLRMKSDVDLITEVLTAQDTASWVHTWVAGKTGSVTYHAYNANMMLVRCADELRATGTMDPATKMSVFQTIIESRRILSTEGYKYRITGIYWVTDKLTERGYPVLLPLFKWDSESDTHLLEENRFNDLLASDKFKEVLYSVDTVKINEFEKEMKLYSEMWHAIKNVVFIFKDIGIFNLIAVGKIEQFKVETKLFTDIFDAQVDMFRKTGTTDWNGLLMIAKREIYTYVINMAEKFTPKNVGNVYDLISKYENNGGN